MVGGSHQTVTDRLGVSCPACGEAVRREFIIINT